MSGSIQKFGDITPQTAFPAAQRRSALELQANSGPHLRNPEGKITLPFQWAKLPKLIDLEQSNTCMAYGHKGGKLALKQLEPEAVHKRKHKSGDITPAQTAAVRVQFISCSTASICVPAAGKFRSSFEESSG